MRFPFILGALLAFAVPSAFATNAAPGFCTFNEADYLAFNPDVAAAVRAGAFPSGAAHYGAYGRNEDRIINRYCIPGAPAGCAYIEADYLAFNADIAQAVRYGTYPSGAAHFGQYGRHEGRVFNRSCGFSSPTPHPPLPPSACVYNERDYLLFNEDVAAAVRAGTFANGYQHYAAHGVNENRMISRFCTNRPGCPYVEADYLRFNADVAQAVRNGTYATGAGHFGRYGRNENRVYNARCR